MAVLIAIFAVSFVPTQDPDLWWHLKTGEWIVTHGAIPRTDPFSFTFAGRPWLNHEWLGEVLLFTVFRAGGLTAVMVLFASLITVTFWIAWRRMRARGVDDRVGLLLLGGAFFAGSLSMGPRLQMFTLFFASLFAYGLERIRSGEAKIWPFALPVLMLLWTNVHGGFAVGLALIVIHAAGEWLDSRDAPRTRKLLIVFGASVAAAIVNPHGIAQLAYPLRFLTPNPYTQLIAESGSPKFHMPAILTFEVLLLVALAGAARAGKRVAWSDVLLLLAFTHLALSQVRNVALWGVVVTPIVASILASLAMPWLEQHGRHAAAALFLSAGIGMALVGLGSKNGDPEEASFPMRAAAVLQQRQLGPNLYTAYRWGGYVIWTLHPRYRVFIDGRADTVYDAAILKEFNDAYNGLPVWRDTFARRGVTTALVETRSFIAVELAHAPEWKLVYNDDQAAIFARAPQPVGRSSSAGAATVQR